MPRIENTVFISYRRVDISWALVIFENLTNHGYDVFFDYSGIASGDFERVILDNIAARAHFLVLLTPSALDRCSEPEDWLRREIEHAITTGRNVVPLKFERFDFGKPTIKGKLTGALATLARYNALEIYPAYFPEAMARLREKFLNISLERVPHPASVVAQQAAREQQAAARTALPVDQRPIPVSPPFRTGLSVLLDADDQLRPGFRTYLSPSILFVAESNASEWITFPSFDYEEGVDVKLHVEHSVPTIVHHFHNPALKINLGDNTPVTNRTRLSLEEITSLVHIEGRFPVVIAPLSGFHGRIWHLRQQNPAREMRHYILVLLYGGANNA